MPKGYKDIIYANRHNIDAKMTAVIEGDNSETERTAARMLKTLTPLLKEIIDSGDLKKVSGFIRGMSSIAGSMVLSLPEFMREGVGKALLEDIERALTLPHPDER